MIINSTHNSGSRPGAGTECPFDLHNEEAYQQWRARKLAHYPTTVESLRVKIHDPAHLTAQEKCDLVCRLRKSNFALYQFDPALQSKDAIRALGEQLGLRRLDDNLCADEDSITSLQVMSGGSRHEGYIPYTNRSINWHTDGYYNPDEHMIRAMLLHCVSPAQEGGCNQLLDHEIVYILMRDTDPDWIRALMRPDVMTIPPNVEGGVEIRPAQTGPVFRIEAGTGNLHMRYSARKRNIEWREDAATQAATAFLDTLFSRGSDYILEYCLQPGEGIISNNALHTRSAFTDGPAHSRLLYRARYYDRVAGTDFNDDTSEVAACCG